MSKRSSRVRGPNSALTEFLRNEGITDAFRERRNREQTPTEDVDEREVAEEDREREPSADIVLNNVGSIRNRRVVEDEEEIEIRVAGREKRKAANPSFPDDSDDGDDDDFEDGGESYKKFGEEDSCVDCGDVFNLSVYSRFLREKSGYLCESCNEKLKQRERNAKRNQLNARRKRKKVALALLDKSTVKIPKLQDVCIKAITQNINDVDVLGDIGQSNMMKISRILSKNRSLDNSTVSLFLNPNLTSLQFWDCSNVDSDSLNRIASYCPNLESLTLFMCGQFHNDNLQYFASNLLKLRELCLNGAFLISDSMWQEYFDECGSRLEKFEIRNTHRFGNDSLISLLERSGPSLTSLKLSRLDGIDNSEVYGLIPHYLQPSQVTHLEISYPHKHELITDELLINILAITGESLVSLNVDGCCDLTEQFLVEGVSKFCPNLTHLSMRELDQVSDEGFAEAFENYSKVNSGGLISVDLCKCTSLGDKALYSLMIYSSHTLVEFNINSIHKLSNDFFLQILTEDHHPRKEALKKKIESGEMGQNDEIPVFYNNIRLPLLTTWDVGFVRAIDDELLTMIGENCPKLSIIEVYGNNRCTFRARIRPGVMIIGRQGDAV